jgi:hypothetical protein
MTLNGFGPVFCMVRKNQRELQKKKTFQFSYGCEQFHYERSFGFLVINVCNRGEHYETPCICRIFRSSDISEDLARTVNPLSSSKKSQIICTYHCTRHNVPEKCNLYQYPRDKLKTTKKETLLKMFCIPITHFTEIMES